MKKLSTVIVSVILTLSAMCNTVLADINVSNDENYIYVTGDHNMTFRTCGVTRYAKTNINLRSEPNLDNKFVVKSVPRGTELLKVGKDSDGWSMVQLDGINYFVRTSCVVSDIPEEPEPEPVSNYIPVDNGNPGGQYLGVWTLTAYCNGACCCGQWAGGGTASGTVPTQGRTIATNELPFGSQVYIEGYGTYIVEDRGYSPYYPWADMYFDSHSAAEQFGLRQANVYLIS